MSKRTGRIAEEIRRIVSDIIRNKIKNRDIAQITSIMEVQVTNDLRYANIYVSVLGSETTQQETLASLNRTSGFVRREMGRELKIRYIPEPKFHLDTSIENAIYISKLIDSVKKEDDGDDE